MIRQSIPQDSVAKVTIYQWLKPDGTHDSYGYVLSHKGIANATGSGHCLVEDLATAIKSIEVKGVSNPVYKVETDTGPNPVRVGQRTRAASSKAMEYLESILNGIEH